MSFTQAAAAHTPNRETRIRVRTPSKRAKNDSPENGIVNLVPQPHQQPPVSAQRKQSVGGRCCGSPPPRLVSAVLPADGCDGLPVAQL